MTNALLRKLKVKVMEWPSMSPDLNPIEQLAVGRPQAEDGEGQYI